MTGSARYRLRAPASGREAVVSLDASGSQGGTGEDVAFYDRVTGERMEVVAKLLPLDGSGSNLPRSPENLRVCPHCEELVGLDASECPFCRRRMPALGGAG